jgi:hypothetical protein
MNSAFYWEVFLETGAPEMYLYYQEAKRSEEAYVSDSTGSCTARNCI